jgi:hypothetical protein
MGELVTFPVLAQLAPTAANHESESQVFEVAWFNRKFYRHEAEKLKKHGIHAMFALASQSFYVMRKDIERMCNILGARVNGIVDGGSMYSRKLVIDQRSSADTPVVESDLRYLERQDEDHFLTGNPNTYFDVRAFGRKLTDYEVRKLRGHKITVSFSVVSDSYHIARSDMEAVLYILQAQLLGVVDTKTAKKVTIDVGALKTRRQAQ